MDTSPQCFLFTCNGLDSSLFRVLHYSGTDTLSHPYRFDITLAANDACIGIDELINKQATLFLGRGAVYHPYSGIVTLCSYMETNVDYSTYSVVLQPSLWRLSLNVQSRIFQKKSVPAIVAALLKEAGLEGYYVMDVRSYPERKYIVQYQESDLDFISRLMEECGIWYFFTEHPLDSNNALKTVTMEQMIITDKADNFEEVSGESTIVFRPHCGMVNHIDQETRESVSRLASERCILPGSVSVKNYNYRTPEIDLSLNRTIPEGNYGNMYLYGGAFRDMQQAQMVANLHRNRFGLQKTVLSGTGDCTGFRAGCRFTLDEHVRPELNTSYLLTGVTHTGSVPDTAESCNTIQYENDHTCIPMKFADCYTPECVTPIPKIPGILTARIEGEGSEYANIDEKGRYKVRMPFERSDTENFMASKYLRLAQTYSGADYGIHFPSHEEAEMIVCHINGDPNKPLGLGTVPNANTISPVRAVNKTQNVIRTAGGNEMIFDDNDGRQKITLRTSKNYRAAFDDEYRSISLNTADGNRLHLDDKNKRVDLTSGDNILTMIYADSDKGISITTVDGHMITMSDSGKCLTIRTSEGSTIAMSDKSKSIVITDTSGTNNITLENENGMSLESKGRISIVAEKELNIQAANITVTGKENISQNAGERMTIKCSSANQIMSGDGAVQLKGNAMNILASGNLKLKGASIDQN